MNKKFTIFFGVLLAAVCCLKQLAAGQIIEFRYDGPKIPSGVSVWTDKKELVECELSMDAAEQFPEGKGALKAVVKTGAPSKHFSKIQISHVVKTKISPVKKFRITVWIKADKDYEDKIPVKALTAVSPIKGLSAGKDHEKFVKLSKTWQKVVMEFTPNIEAESARLPTVSIGALPTGAIVWIGKVLVEDL